MYVHWRKKQGGWGGGVGGGGGVYSPPHVYGCNNNLILGINDICLSVHQN